MGEKEVRRMTRRQMLLEFYAASGDFTRRLTSVRANAKFSAPDAGPEDYFSVRGWGRGQGNRHSGQD